jgi:hypothetical protein
MCAHCWGAAPPPTRARTQVATVARTCGGTIDLAFLLDGSGSVGLDGWRSELEFVLQVCHCHAHTVDFLTLAFPFLSCELHLLLARRPFRCSGLSKHRTSLWLNIIPPCSVARMSHARRWRVVSTCPRAAHTSLSLHLVALVSEMSLTLTTMPLSTRTTCRRGSRATSTLSASTTAQLLLKGALQRCVQPLRACVRACMRYMRRCVCRSSS